MQVELAICVVTLTRVLWITFNLVLDKLNYEIILKSDSMTVRNEIFYRSCILHFYSSYCAFLTTLAAFKKFFFMKMQQKVYHACWYILFRASTTLFFFCKFSLVETDVTPSIYEIDRG